MNFPSVGYIGFLHTGLVGGQNDLVFVQYGDGIQVDWRRRYLDGEGEV